MGFDDGCNTGLVLGLGFTAHIESTPSKANLNQMPRRPSLKFDPAVMEATSFEPSLSLGLPGEIYHQTASATVARKVNIDMNKGVEESGAAHDQPYRQASPHSAVSSFSSGRVKRERDLSSEEIEVERVSSRVSDEDEDGVNARKKLRLTKEQSALLEESFKQHSTLNPVIISYLSLSLFPFPFSFYPSNS